MVDILPILRQDTPVIVYLFIHWLICAHDIGADSVILDRRIRVYYDALYLYVSLMRTSGSDVGPRGAREQLFGRLERDAIKGAFFLEVTTVFPYFIIPNAGLDCVFPI